MKIVAAAVLLIIIIAFAAMTAHIRRHPLETFVKMTRRGLRRAGMMRRAIDVAGNQVSYFAGGNAGRTIVLVHGVNDQAGTWVSVIPLLIKDFRVIAIDLPGHGESGPATGPLPMPMMVKALEAVIDRESPASPVILVGNSMGGWVSMLYAADHPSRLTHLILEDASGMSWDMSHVAFFPKTRDEALKVLRMVHGPDVPIADYLIDALLKNSATMPQARVIQAGVMFALVDARLHEITTPATLIWGAHDGLLPIAYAESLQQHLPGSSLHIIESAAHIPHRQAPAEFTRLLREAIQ
jgi:pimeloyl-ACP methyl ester carboxylesterase